jgi:hypothetical protein
MSKRKEAKKMEIYTGTLTLLKTTAKMVVYGNQELRAQYIPKHMFEALGLEDHPAELLFNITVPNDANDKATGDADTHAGGPAKKPLRRKAQASKPVRGKVAA